jgi:hypothetical protein
MLILIIDCEVSLSNENRLTRPFSKIDTCHSDRFIGNLLSFNLALPGQPDSMYFELAHPLNPSPDKLFVNQVDMTINRCPT